VADRPPRLVNILDIKGTTRVPTFVHLSGPQLKSVLEGIPEVPEPPERRPVFELWPVPGGGAIVIPPECGLGPELCASVPSIRPGSRGEQVGWRCICGPPWRPPEPPPARPDCELVVSLGPVGRGGARRLVFECVNNSCRGGCTLVRSLAPSGTGHRPRITFTCSCG
jgi:hypothetical protein